MTKLSFRLLGSLVFLLPVEQVFAAACCGGGFAAPALITGDDKAQVTTSYSYSQIVDDVGADSLWRPRDTLETSETLKIEASHIFWDQWQTGLSVPVVRRSTTVDSSSGLGDIAGTLGYEYLPDWDYSPWRPKGLAFLQLTAPTGRSVNESQNDYQLDARGRGFWALGVGTILTKIMGKWDVFSDVDAHRSFDRVYGGTTGTLRPGYGGNFALGGGYNLVSLRVGSSLTWTYEDPIDVIGPTSTHGAPQQYATASLSASYLFEHEWAATFTYADQTLFGSPTNTTLGRGATVFLQKRWPR